MCKLILKFVEDKGRDKEKTTNANPNIEATPKQRRKTKQQKSMLENCSYLSSLLLSQEKMLWVNEIAGSGDWNLFS